MAIQVKNLTGTAYSLICERIEKLLLQLIKPGSEIRSDLILASFPNQNTRICGTFEENVLVGIALGTFKCHFTGCELYVDDVVVDVTYRGKGVGSLLMDALEACARRHGCDAVMLTSSRPDAQRLYEKRGYTSETRFFKKQLA